MADEQKLSEVRGAVDDFQVNFANLLEAGLFREADVNETGGPAASALRELQNSREAVEAGRVADAEEALMRGRVLVESAVHREGLPWRWIHIYQIHWFGYHVAAMIVVLNAATGWLAPVTSLDLTTWPPFAGAGFADTIWDVPGRAFGFGALGGIARGLYWLHVQVSGRLYRVHFGMSHFAAPWIGSLFGALAYLALSGGLLALGEESPDGAAVWAIVFVAGYSWNTVLGWIAQLGARGDVSGG